MAYLEPPTREMKKFAESENSETPKRLKKTKEQLLKHIRAYKIVTERENRTCENCQRMHLAAPALRLALKNTKESEFDPDNLMLLCPPCNRQREATLRTADFDADPFAAAQVVEREGRRCVYCLRGPLYGENVRTAARVAEPRQSDPEDWALCCKTCLKARGTKSHEEYVEQAKTEALELFGYLRDL